MASGFIENKGQYAPQVLYKMDLPSGALFLENLQFTYHFRDPSILEGIHNKSIVQSDSLFWKYHSFNVAFVGANSSAEIKAKDKGKEYYNFFLGNNPNQWATEVYSYKNVSYSNIYDKTDLHIYENGDGLKYDFVVKPGGNPKSIQLKVAHVNIKLENGALVYKTSVGDIYEQKPVAYQFIDKKYVEVPCEFVIENNVYYFSLGDYDSTASLVIDPNLVFSTFSGASSNNFGNSATFDKFGNLYSGSITFGINYPTTMGAYQVQFNGGNTDMAISKFSDDGSTLLYSSLIGGSADELCHSLIVDERDNLYVLGTSGSFDFPMQNPYDSTMGGGAPINMLGLGVFYTNGCDMVAFKFNSTGTQLMASTYLGGSGNDGLNTVASLKYNYADEVRGEVLIDQDGDILIVSSTQSSDFNFTNPSIHPNYLGGNQDGVILKLNANLNQVLWGTYWGGASEDALYSVSIDANNDIYVAGGTNSFDYNAFSFPAFNTFQGGRSDGMIAKLSANGQQTLLATYYGTPDYDQIYFIEVDADTNIFVFGQTETNGSPYQINATYGQARSGQFVTKFNPQLNNWVWSSQFGVSVPPGQNASPNISPTAFMVDICSAVYLAGWGGASNVSGPGINNNAGFTTGLTTTTDAFQDSTDGSDFYLLVLRDDGSAPIYASFFGGPNSDEHVDGGTSRFDRSGKIYQAVCAGCGGLSDLFTTPNAFSTTNNANCNLAVFKFDFDLPLVISNFNIEEFGCAPFNPNIENLSQSQGGPIYFWDFGNGFSSSDSLPITNFTQKGAYEVRFVVTDSNSCNFSDTSFLSITIDTDTVFGFPQERVCFGDTTQIQQTFNPNNRYLWQPNVNLIDTSGSIATIIGNQSNRLILFRQEPICTDTLIFPIVVDTFLIQSPNDTLICSADSSNVFRIGSFGEGVFFQFSSNSSFSDTLNNNLSDSTFVIANIQDTNLIFVLSRNFRNCQALDSFTVVRDDFKFDLLSDTTVCLGDTAHFELNLISGSWQSILWQQVNGVIGNTDTLVFSLRSNAQQLISYQATSSNNCNFSDSALIDVDSIVLLPLIDTLLCAPVQSFTFQPQLSVNQAATWSLIRGVDNDSLIVNQTTDIFQITNPLQSSRYFLSVVNDNNCRDTTSFLINLSFLELQALVDSNICMGDSIQINANVQRGDLAGIEWFNTNNIIGPNNQTNILVAPDVFTQYNYLAVNTDNCEKRDTISIDVSNLSQTNFDLTLNDTLLFVGQQLIANLSPAGNYQISWFLNGVQQEDKSFSFFDFPNEDVVVEVLIEDPANKACNQKLQKNALVKEVVCEEPFIYVPNAFSPNGDGENDVFRVRGEAIESLDLKIFNRWSNLIFETTNVNDFWDGSYQGESLGPDVFVYSLRLQCFGGEIFEKQGNITLLK